MDESSNLLMQVLMADPEKRVAIERILKGGITPPAATPKTGPLLLRMTEAARLLGTSRTTVWRAIAAGRLPKIEILPNSFRVRREDVEALAGYGGTKGGAL